MINISNLQKSFGKNEVLQGIDLDFQEKGAITAILGPNGSGKTTLIKSILGMVIPDRGEITVDGQAVRDRWAYRARIDYLPQIARFPENLTIRELVDLIGDVRGNGPNREEELFRLFGLHPFLDQRLGALSGGTRQKVNLTLAFLYDNPLLILDEPTNGLDPVALIRLKDFIRRERQRGKLIIITTHIMSLVEELADEIVFILEGKVYFRGTVAMLKEQYHEADLERAIARILTVEQPRLMNGNQAEGVAAALPAGVFPGGTPALHPIVAKER